ncbi:neurotracting/lsamp/neurotrimin/obcam related cell adhesion molecule [Echinococcus granulosus]|uniref:Neurotracting/lsamp/neurotrimin/obcam related cell adhesion molecule n=1 Tax=Echinococcus granulosus TaxID=6210 RepID=W6UVY4_ECHGR|nr:neurotracting/lsamp/neurotrimin/obcam related cell adhesion molecule [Echinococcus granulosus]EUB62587.1 neurotracting/lsamp/neurotrimin/obcam related cell adhesion molecule [Echinococcus granulosus]
MRLSRAEHNNISLLFLKKYLFGWLNFFCLTAQFFPIFWQMTLILFIKLMYKYILFVLSLAVGAGNLVFAHYTSGVNQFIPQIVDSINVEVVQEKNTGYLNCTMVLDESQINQKKLLGQNFTSFISDIDNYDVILLQASWYYGERQISIGSKLLEPVRIGLYGLEKYQARFFPGRPDFAPNMPAYNLIDLSQTYKSTPINNCDLFLRKYTISAIPLCSFIKKNFSLKNFWKIFANTFICILCKPNGKTH